MRAIQIVEVGGRLAQCDVPDPHPGPGEVIVKVTAAGVCHSDVHYLDGVSPVGKIPITPGHEIAGIVEGVGRSVESGLDLFSRVCIHYLVTCGACYWCTSGKEQWCASAQMLGKDRDGGYAEYVVVPRRNVMPIPDSVSDAHAAVMMCSSATALHAIRKARLQPGETVAVFGCGGLGTSAIQIAAILGADTIYAVDIKPDKLALARRLGAIAVDASSRDPVSAILDATDGRGVNVSLELLGIPATVQQAVRVAAPHGRAAIAGIVNGPVTINPYTELIGQEAEIIGVSDHHASEIGELLGWADQGRFQLDDVVTNTVGLNADDIGGVFGRLRQGLAPARTVILPMLMWMLVGLLAPAAALAQSSDSTANKPLVRHGDKGFEFESVDGNYLLQIDSRLQFRYAYPQDTDPFTEQNTADTTHVLKINRARLKIGGHAFKPWFKYYWEYDLVGSNLLDFRVMVERFEWLKVKVGQWKVQYNRERAISSGKQQTADRSIINRVFTVDRQQGASLFGHLRSSGPIDFNYWLSVFTGTGRGASENDDGRLMWMGRLQWNPLGRAVPQQGSDTKMRDEPALLLAVAGVTNQSQYTFFSTSGGSNPGGYEGEAGQFIVDQVQIETAFMYRGLSWQHESHWKHVDDTINDIQSRVVGSYFQGGVFPAEWFAVVPEALEVAFRYAYYIPDTLVDDDLRDEVTLAINWFFRGHRSKLTAEVSDFDLFDAETGQVFEEFRYRLQLDVSL